MPVPVSGSAEMSACGRYQWSLSRSWKDGPPADHRRVAWIMLNPSTGDAEADDPTIRCCVRFSRDWGFDALVLVNLFAFQTAYPHKLREADFPVGDQNDEAILVAARESALVVAGWGEYWHPKVRERAGKVLSMLSCPPNRIAIECLGFTSEGAPRHPSRVRADAQRRLLTPWVA